MVRGNYADRIDAGADYIETHGWTRHEIVDENGAVCTYGGLLAGCGMPLTNNAIERLPKGLVKAVERVIPDFSASWCELADWNDESDRTMQEVLDALRLAAKQERMKL